MGKNSGRQLVGSRCAVLVCLMGVVFALTLCGCSGESGAASSSSSSSASSSSEALDKTTSGESDSASSSSAGDARSAEFVAAIEALTADELFLQEMESIEDAALEDSVITVKVAMKDYSAQADAYGGDQEEAASAAVKKTYRKIGRAILDMDAYSDLWDALTVSFNDGEFSISMRKDQVSPRPGTDDESTIEFWPSDSDVVRS